MEHFVGLLSEPLGLLTGALLLGLLAQWIAWRTRLPSILLLLGFGFMSGLAGANPDQLFEGSEQQEMLFALVSMSVAVILFEGGLTLRLSELRRAGHVVLRLVSLGVAVAWLGTTWACYFLIGMDLRVAALTGAILVVTGPTVIAPLLRQIRPTRQISSIVKWEGIVIDPIGALLAVVVYEVIFVGQLGEGASSTGEWLWAAVQILGFTVLVAASLAGLAAWLMVQLLKRYLIPDFLHTMAFLVLCLVSFAVSNALQSESGLLTVTLLGLLLTNQKAVPVQHVVEFKENLRVLLISCLFIVLAARIELSEILALGWGGVAFLACLILIVRPLSVFVATIATQLNWRQRMLLAFLAPRGIVAAAVSSVFALEISLKYAEPPVGADQIVSVTFLTIVGTVTVYGLLAGPLARLLGLAVARPQGILFAGASTWVRSLAIALQAEDIPVRLVDTNFPNVSAARLEGIPVHCASILSEYVSEELDLAGIGRLLAVTPNDDLNTRAANEFAQVFGRANVYQLSRGASEGRPRTGKRADDRGRYLFGEHVTHADLTFQFFSRAVVKTTQITEEFTFQHFQELYGAEALVLFVKTESGELAISTSDAPLVPKPRQTVFALVQPREAPVPDAD